MENYKLLNTWKSKGGKYTMTAYCYEPLCTYLLEHKKNDSVQGVSTGIRTPQELNTKIAYELDNYKRDGINLIKG